jgi:hypothetical protein
MKPKAISVKPVVGLKILGGFKVVALNSVV